MSTVMVVDAVRMQFEAAGEAFARRPQGGKPSENAAFAEDAIVVFLDRPSTMRRVVDRVWEIQRAGRFGNLLQAWHEVSVLFDLAMRQAKPLLEMIDLAQKAGYTVERADEFERAVRELEQLRQDFQGKFPVVTEVEAAEDRAAMARGDYHDADTAFARIAGVDVETWRRRVEEYEGGQQR